MKIKIGAAILLLGIATNASAGWMRLTTHSRANCIGFNESVTWHKGHPNTLKTLSIHMPPNKIVHRLVANWANTWRSAAYHLGEAYAGSGWIVQGWHWMEESGNVFLLASTNAIDCRLYDGWWDV